MQTPKVIFLDAVGTLFGIRGSVGMIYGQVAQQWGVTVDSDLLDQAFRHSFRHSPPAAFPGVAPADIPQQEFLWWQAIAAQTFQQVGVFDQFPNFSDFFRGLYAHFESADPWFVYPDVAATLEHWRSQGIELGVLSNFDTRLYAVLQCLNLAPYIASVTISTEVGAAKPDPKIFQAALANHDAASAEVWHVGDSYAEDYQGAIAAGFQGIWLQRQDSIPQRLLVTEPGLPRPRVIQSLAELLARSLKLADPPSG